MNHMKLEDYIDHTLLKATATESEIQKLCEEAIQYGFFSVCVNSAYVPFATSLLADAKPRVAAVVGFPLGAMSTEIKIAEASYCVEHGASEIDVVWNLGWFKSGYHKKVEEELRSIKNAIGSSNLKVIVESCYLDHKEKVEACRIVMDSGADYIKTSTGFGPAGATFEDVALFKEQLGDLIKIKASGGIRDRETAKNYIAIGASRLGTSSGIKIINS